ncbi:MAG: hypothetical protein RBR86_06925 [Pseudobdellovibrionaceae bacterium]|jgi:hypothetical protein|nr:hypothetical protein [Pseudobdellovibrionaceae bacterium]
MSNALKAKIVRACVAGSAHCLPTLDFTMSASGQSGFEQQHGEFECPGKDASPVLKPL